MLIEEIRRIIDEEFSARKSEDAARPHIRRRLILRVAEEVARPSIPKRNWDVFVSATETECDLWPFLKLGALLKSGIGAESMSVDEVKTLLGLCKKTEEFCEFLMDNYDNAPRRLQNFLSFSEIMEISADIATRHEKLSESFKNGRDLCFDFTIPKSLKTFINFVWLAALGDDLYNKFVREIGSVAGIAESYDRLKVSELTAGS